MLSDSGCCEALWIVFSWSPFYFLSVMKILEIKTPQILTHR